MSEMAVALLRGINVGGKNLLPMKSLAAMFAAAGCTDVKTYIQSGNVVFRSMQSKGRGASTHLGDDSAVAKMGHPHLRELSDTVRAEIATQFGLKVPVVVRSATEMMKAVACNSFVERGIDAAWLHVMFLEDEPTAAMIAGLDAGRSTPDEFVVKGREVYLYLPNGAAKTKLTNAYFDSKLKTVGTQRNWRTVMTLAEMMSA